jgi:hypothetical protein
MRAPANQRPRTAESASATSAVMLISATKMHDMLKSPATSIIHASSLAPFLRREAARRSIVVTILSPLTCEGRILAGARALALLGAGEGVGPGPGCWCAPASVVQRVLLRPAMPGCCSSLLRVPQT